MEITAKEIYKHIANLKDLDSSIFSDEVRASIRYAVEYLAQTAPKPYVTEPITNIRYATPYKSDWKWFTHVPTKKHIEDMTIEEVVGLVRTGALDLDKFESITSVRQRRLDSNIAFGIKAMLYNNGYITREELWKEWRKK